MSNNSPEGNNSQKYFVEANGVRVMPLTRIALEFSIDESKMNAFVDNYITRKEIKL